MRALGMSHQEKKTSHKKQVLQCAVWGPSSGVFICFSSEKVVNYFHSIFSTLLSYKRYFCRCLPFSYTPAAQTNTMLFFPPHCTAGLITRNKINTHEPAGIDPDSIDQSKSGLKVAHDWETNASSCDSEIKTLQMWRCVKSCDLLWPCLRNAASYYQGTGPALD